MKFAIIADIHGNSSALEAVLADMDHLGVADVINLGDHFSGPLDAAATADLLIARDFPSIRGNHDRWLIETAPEDMGPSDRVAFEQLEQSHLEWLRNLRPSFYWKDEVFACHGTPDSDATYWLEQVDPEGTVRSAGFDDIEARADGINASLILCGHTHIPRLVRLRDGRIILNPGSVGCPAYDDDVPVFHLMQTGTPNASYAIAEKAGDDWSFTFRSVPYDPSRMIEHARSNGRDEWARALATGWIE
ncbi:Predicted phosphodiesterase [Cohaesibacter sp. ES.047]|uniref:metallophosphoesterase family protein n=1 Tax=Cohaesibacter sp. ES.047 TaxID=1798205 RepID=UPI000BB70F08|nr:metallophosphoesterase family protein [Cohaesibacter sp. ES.047]SNY93610.1 Predicted phosphodiesterase [Cohaesibacter sp. ES.047]